MAALVAVAVLLPRGGTGDGVPAPAGDNDAAVDARAQVAFVTAWEATRSSAPPPEVHRRLTVARGDSLIGILTGAGVGRTEAHAALSSLKGLYDPRRDLAIGDVVTVVFAPGPFGAGAAAPRRFAGVRLPVAFDRYIAIDRATGGDGYTAREVTRAVARADRRVDGIIRSSLYRDGVAAGVPVPVLAELIRIYSFDVDFQRQVHPDDSFAVMFERFADAGGTVVHDGEIVHARLVLGGETLPVYRYETTAGTVDWFDASGESARKALMKTPLDGARLSSGFGNRRHPILGYTRLHGGVDFAAPTGTPVFAAGNGTVEVIGRNGGYGKYVRIRHNGTYKTAYAHLSGYARGMTRGARVRQGQVIGFVGSTGLSTGPHLHYEIHRDGHKIDPLGLRLPSGEKLAGKELERFLAHRARIDDAFAALGTAVAARDFGPEATGSCAPGDAPSC